MYIDINHLDIKQMSLDYNIDKKLIIKSINQYNLRYDYKVLSNRK